MQKWNNMNIQDELTKEWYCIDKYDGSDYSYWSRSLIDAFKFSCIMAAQSEMQFREVTNNQTRKPVIVYN